MKLTSLSTIAAIAAIPFIFTACSDDADTDGSDDTSAEAGADDSDDDSDDDDADDDDSDDDDSDDDDSDDSDDDDSDDDDSDDAEAGADDSDDDDADDDGSDAGDVLTDAGAEGDAEAPVEGDAEAPVEGDAEAPVEGDAEAPVEGEGGGEGGDMMFGAIGLFQSVTVTEIEGLDPIVSAFGTGFASFSISSGGAASECATDTVDSCTLTVCEIDPDAEAGSSTTVDAGEITFSGLDAELPAMTFDETTGYSASATELLWDGSKDVTIDVAGSDDVPAFSATLTLPDAVAFTAPEVDPTTFGIEVSRAENLDVTWDDGDVGTVTVSVNAATDTQSFTIFCSAAAADGSLTVDQSLLADLPDEGSVAAQVQSTDVASDTGDWTVSLSATQSSLAGTATFVD